MGETKQTHCNCQLQNGVRVRLALLSKDTEEFRVMLHNCPKLCPALSCSLGGFDYTNCSSLQNSSPLWSSLVVY